MSGKMKIIWLCPFSLNEAAHFLKLNEMQQKKFRPYPWTSNLLEEFKGRDDLELHLITRSNRIKYKDVIVKNNKITYYFLKRSLPFVPRRFYNSYFNYDINSHYYFFLKKIERMVKKINPDIINSFGTENEYSLILNKLDYPSVVTIGGFINSVVSQNDGYLNKIKLKLENKVLCKQKNFAIRNEFMKNIIFKYNFGANFYYYYFPLKNYIFELHKNKPEYDCDIVYAANIAKEKGIEDLIHACSLIKEKVKNVKVKIIGFGRDTYLNKIRNLIIAEKLSDNIIIKGFLSEHKDVYKEINRSKICVLPTYFDTSPGTVCEAMSLKVPVISYNTDGLPYMIKNNYSGILVEKGNISALAESITGLLKNHSLRAELAENAYKFALDNFTGSKVFEKVMNSYLEIIERKN